MRTINVGGTEIKINGTPLTPLYYKREFGQSFSGDLMSLRKAADDVSMFDDINLLQMIWAMQKTAGETVDKFESWLGTFEFLDLSNVMQDVVEEGARATFRQEPRGEEDESQKQEREQEREQEQ